MPVETDERCLGQIARHEGAVRDRNGMHRAYRCPAGRLTIGYGHNLEAWPVLGLSAASRIDEDRARELLREDCARTARMLDAALPWWRGLSLPRQAVCLSMAFNLGVQGFLRFAKTIEFLRRGEWAKAGAEMLKSRWARQVGARAGELAEQMESGLFLRGDADAR